MMVSFRALSASLLFSAVAASIPNTTECHDAWVPQPDRDACAQPVEDVMAVTPGSFYTAKIRCNNCPYLERTGTGVNQKDKLVFGNNDLFFTIKLSHDNRTILLNDEPFFPTLPTVPTPPKLRVPQVRPEFSYQNLSTALACENPLCLPGIKETYDCSQWCWNIQLDTVPIDYLYMNKDTEYKGNATHTDAQYWEFNIDAIGGFAERVKDSDWGFDSAGQKMLKVVVEGTEVRQGNPKNGQDTLFSPLREERAFDYRIVHVTLVDRGYEFPARKALSFFQGISRFFGNDVWESQGRLVYIRAEWETYGKAGTLRSMFGDIVHWDKWYMTTFVTACVVASLLALYGFYRLFFWMQEQRELMKWDGMDDVWDKLRREREEEENALLHGYRDDPGEGSSPRSPQYTDDLDTMKPLPKKPLPEKPLPDVPLIDA